MGHKRVGLDREHDERSGRGGTVQVEPPGAKNVHDHLLHLQRDYGNEAVTSVVQRKRSKAASTDAPGAKKKVAAKPGKQAPAEASYAPTDHIPGLADVSTSDLSQDASDFMSRKDGNTEGNLERASRDYLELWFRTPGKSSRSYATQLYRCYRDMKGEEKRAAYWSKVASGEIDPKAPKQEDMSDKEF